jgi:hypothetical protein
MLQQIKKENSGAKKKKTQMKGSRENRKHEGK